MAKGSKTTIKRLGELLQLLKDADVYERYITPAGQGFLDGIFSAGAEIEWVPKDDYDHILQELEKEKAYKFKLFGLKL